MTQFNTAPTSLLSDGCNIYIARKMLPQVPVANEEHGLVVVLKHSLSDAIGGWLQSKKDSVAVEAVVACGFA